MSEANGIKKWFTKKELANRWKVCTKTIERMEASGKLTPIYIADRIKRYPEDVIEKVERRA
jgi:hypothetical protein